MPEDVIAVVAGLVIGGVIGATVLLTNFCALGGIADILFAKDWRRMRSWILAAGVAMVGVHGVDAAGLIQLDRATPLDPYILWLPAIFGGLIFGFGMALAGGCPSRALARIGAGSLRSAVAMLVVGLCAAAMGFGILAQAEGSLTRLGATGTFGPAGLHRILGNFPVLGAETIRWIIVMLAGGGMILFALKDQWFRRSRDHVLSGAIIGLAIVAAWVVAGLSFEARGTGSFTAINFIPPLKDIVLTLGGWAPEILGVAIILGVPLGSFVAAAVTRNLAFDTFADRSDVVRTLGGAALMGVGGTLAMGCTFGQGLSGLSALSVTAFCATAGIIAGCVWGIRTFEAGSPWGGLRLVFFRQC